MKPVERIPKTPRTSKLSVMAQTCRPIRAYVTKKMEWVITRKTQRVTHGSKSMSEQLGSDGPIDGN